MRRSSNGNSLDQMFRQMFAAPSQEVPLPPPPPPTPMTQVMEDFMYQYNRNIRDYNHNIRLLTQQLDIFTRDSGRRRRPSMTQQYTFSFEPFPQQQQQPEEPPPLSESDLLQRVRMSTFHGGPNESADGGVTCPISLERFREGDDVCEIVGCGHQFKREPALRWLRRNPVCPVCRYDLRTGNIPPATSPPPPARAAAEESSSLPSSSNNNILHNLARTEQMPVLPNLARTEQMPVLPNLARTEQVPVLPNLARTAEQVPVLQQIIENLVNRTGPVANNLAENLTSFLSRDISGSQLLYEFEMPLEMLAQSLLNRYSSRDDDEDLEDQPVD